MFNDLTACGGVLGHHAWVLGALIDLAAYAEKEGLARLHAQLCHAVATAAIGELAGSPPSTEKSGVVQRADRTNVVSLRS